MARENAAAGAQLPDDSLLPPFFEPDFLDPALDRFVDEVLLDAAAARFVEPAVFFADDFLPAAFVPPRADEDDFFDAAVERPVFEADFAPPRAEDFEAPADLEPPFDDFLEDVFEADLVDVRDVPFEAPFEAFLAPVFEAAFDAPFLAPPLFADDLDAVFFAPPEDVFAALFLDDEAPLLVDDLVPFFALDEELLVPLFLDVVEVAEPPEEPAVLG